MHMRGCRGLTLQRWAVATRSRISLRAGRASMLSTSSRRQFIVGSTLLTFTLAGCSRKMTPAQARASDVPLRALDTGTVAVLDALGETLVPGSAAAGLAHYIDHQLSGPVADSMLMVKYLGVSAPFA